MVVSRSDRSCNHLQVPVRPTAKTHDSESVNLIFPARASTQVSNDDNVTGVSGVNGTKDSTSARTPYHSSNNSKKDVGISPQYVNTRSCQRKSSPFLSIGDGEIGERGLGF